jgi:hypothetical protein
MRFSSRSPRRWCAPGRFRRPRTNARLAAFLRERGYKPAGGQAPDASGWAAWRNRTDRVFGTLFPPAAERAAAVAAPLAR